MSKRKKKNKKPQYYVDEYGVTHLLIDTQLRRNTMHFDVQRNTHVTIVENKKHKQPKHKGKIFDDE